MHSFAAPMGSQTSCTFVRPNGRSMLSLSKDAALGKIINLFNHKGGVSKTTTVFNLAWMLGTWEDGHHGRL